MATKVTRRDYDNAMLMLVTGGYCGYQPGQYEAIVDAYVDQLEQRVEELEEKMTDAKERAWERDLND